MWGLVGKVLVFLMVACLFVAAVFSLIERLQDVEDTAIGNEDATTWTVWVSMTGEPLGMCPSKGFGQQEEHGTWVFCREPNGDLYPQYVEPNIIVFSWEVRFVRDKLGWRRIERVKDATPDPANRIPQGDQ